jgi:hypothetical protein
MCYEFEDYLVRRAEEARREAKRLQEERAKQQKPEQPVAPDGVKDPEPVPV